MTIDIAINAKQTAVHITRRPTPTDLGTTRRYRNVSVASIARLRRVAPLAVVAGVYRATVTK